MTEPLGETPESKGVRDHRALLTATQELLWISSAEDAQRAAVRLIEALGGHVVPADVADGSAIPVDVSFGHGPPLLPVAPGSAQVHTALQRVLPAFVRDAHRAVELAERTERLAEEASIDPLTGLANRRAVGRALGRLRSDDVIVALDLDHFKRLNDSLGHAQGDRVLQAFGQLLGDSVRARDIAGRVGGEEFVVVLSTAEDTDAEAFLERLHKQWEAARPHPVTFSAGLASVGGHPGRALLLADAAMYRAKAAGRDTWRWAEDSQAGHASSPAPPSTDFVAVSRVPAPADGLEALVSAFHDRLRATETWAGFDRLEVWAEQDDPTRCLLVSWWDDEASFRAYLGSAGPWRSQAHRPAAADGSSPTGTEGYRVVPS